MVDRGLCPNPECRQPIDAVHAAEITVLAGAQQFVGVSFSCPKCRAVISVEVNPWYAKAFSELLEKPGGDGA